MGHLQEYYEKLPTEQLRIERSEINKKIDENDGRLTTDSSADLDYNLDKIEAIDVILANRSGVEIMLEKIKDDLRQRMADYHDSRQPTGDEVTIAWLISEIDILNEKIDNLTLFQK